MNPPNGTKQRLLRIAVELIWEHSYGAVGVDEICKRADVRKGSFYHFFPSKSDLAVAAYEENWRSFQEIFDRDFSPQVPPLERLSRYVDLALTTQRQQFEKTGKVCGCPFASIGSELSTQDEKIRRKSEEVFERICRYFESALRDADREGLIRCPHPAEKAHQLFSFAIGMLLQAKVRNSLAPLDYLKPGFFRLLGMGQDGEAGRAAA